MSDFTGNKIKDTFQRVLQVDGGNIQNGTGNLVDATINSLTASNGFQGNINGTSSFALTSSYSSYAQTASYTRNLQVSGSINNVDYIDFNESAGVTVQSGQLAWNSSDGTLDLGLKGGNVTLQLGQETLYEVRNATGVIIPNGTAVYASGVTVGSGRIEASPFTSDGSVRDINFLGLATEDIGIGVNGFVTHFGYTRGLDTRGTAPSSVAVGDENWSVGDILYAHPTVAGKLTNVKPKHEISVAIIINRHQTTGVLFVRPTSFGHLFDNHDVNINTGSLSTGDLLIYDSGSDYWTNSRQLTGSYGLTGSLSIDNGGITGSVFGTASYATTALTASNALTSSYVNTLTQNVIITGSLDVSGSVTATSYVGNGINNGKLLAMTELTASTLATFTVPSSTVFAAINCNSDATNRYAKITFTAPSSGIVEIIFESDIVFDNSAAVQMIGLNTTSTSTTTPNAGWFRINGDADSSSASYRASFIINSLTPGTSYTYYVMGVCNFSGNLVRCGSLQTGAYVDGADRPSPLRVYARDIGTTVITTNPSS